MFYKKRIIDLREKHNLKQYEIAEILQLAPTTYSNYENEYKLMPIKYLNELYNLFSVSIDYVFQFTNLKVYKSEHKQVNRKSSVLRLKELRIKKRITQNTLADFLKVSQSTISNIESGINIISTPFLYQICKKYNISADYLLGKTDEPKYLK